ncbi:MAG: alanine racemase, partial [Lachnospiraceae bacterium]|nr:alanine racemase [Lachnospiraceae bacterium]
MRQYSRVCAYVDLDAMLFNVRSMKDNLKKETKIIAVIKTNGYGHGAVPMAERLEKEDCIFGYAVATAEEALELREAGMQKPILILGYVFPEHFEAMIGQDIRLSVFREDQLRELAEVAERLGRKAFVHIKVDSAMSRIGVFPDDAGFAFVKAAMEQEWIETEGLFTHFARADELDKGPV